MTRRRPSAAEVHAGRDEAEQVVERAIASQLRAFLRDVVDVATGALSSPRFSPSELVAAATPGWHQLRLPLTLGELFGAWASRVATTGTTYAVQDAVRQAWMTGYQTQRGGLITSSTLDGLDTYLGNVSDRLVQGLVPPVHGDVFDRVRVATSRAAGMGWSTEELAGRIAADLSWETKGPYWRGVHSNASAALDGLLDPLGPPGSPGREVARLHDPMVTYWQGEMSSASQHLNAERSYWQSRATTIARTEATGSYNFGSMNALGDEGVERKEWLASPDARVRESHADADGQVVGLNEDFSVGGYSIAFPGESGGPPEEVVNCRCTVVGEDV